MSEVDPTSRLVTTVFRKRCGLCDHEFEESAVSDEFGESETLISPYEDHISSVHPDWTSPFGPGGLPYPMTISINGVSLRP